MKKFETGDYLWFRDDRLVRVESFANYQGTTRVEFVTYDYRGVFTVNDDDLEPVVHTYEDDDGDTWDLNLNDGLYYLRGGNTEIASRGHERHELEQYGVSTSKDLFENVPEAGTYLKPKDAVYEVLGWDASDNTAKVRDVETGQIHSILLEFYEETKPPRPKIGQVWVKRSDDDPDGVAYTVAEWLGSFLIKLIAPNSELVLPNEELETSRFWSRIF